LSPIQSEKELNVLINDGLNLKSFVQKGLLDIKINHLFCVDSSQMEDSQRDEIVRAIHPEYVEVDGVVIIHGTDSGADTAKYLHLALPYYDPRAIWKNDSRVFNWGKPVVVLSSQVPAVDATNHKLTYRIDSDAPMNLTLALMIIADGEVGEAGIITNNGDALRGPASEKGAEVDIPPYRSDPGVPSMGKYTALGIRYLPQGYLQRAGAGQAFVPFVIPGASEYGEKVVTVFEPSHLNILKAYLGVNNGVAAELKARLPDVVIYVSKGAGNVMSQDYKILKSVEKEGVLTFRVPLPGGRIPTHQLYDVPGHELPALNMQHQTAKYKAMMCLYLAEKVFKLKDERKREFVEKMMKAPWGNEFLPKR
ncbi:asparaginase, partial [Candidatus Woesearchaeota archaeon]|nr:asparaginase [Candidatus Woesearchaeota archaeon]